MQEYHFGNHESFDSNSRGNMAKRVTNFFSLKSAAHAEVTDFSRLSYSSFVRYCNVSRLLDLHGEEECMANIINTKQCFSLNTKMACQPAVQPAMMCEAFIVVNMPPLMAYDCSGEREQWNTYPALWSYPHDLDRFSNFFLMCKCDLKQQSILKNNHSIDLKVLSENVLIFDFVDFV